jgi:hypothetical protein
MSDLRVALVCEGKTDEILIEAALKALLPRPFVMTVLQPEPIRPVLGTGWGGVLRWCDEFAKRGYPQLEDDPTMPGFDLFVIHVDADVADKSDSDYGPESARVAVERGWPTLPMTVACPPPTGSVDAVRACLLAWAKMRAPGPKTVLCVPSKAVEAWLTAALFNHGNALLAGLECNSNLEAQLRTLRMAERIKKTPRDYRARVQSVTGNWSVVRQRCSQAERFSVDIEAVRK